MLFFSGFPCTTLRRGQTLARSFSPTTFSLLRSSISRPWRESQTTSGTAGLPFEFLVEEIHFTKANWNSWLFQGRGSHPVGLEDHRSQVLHLRRSGRGQHLLLGGKRTSGTILTNDLRMTIIDWSSNSQIHSYSKVSLFIAWCCTYVNAVKHFF